MNTTLSSIDIFGEIAALEENWNGYGAAPIPSDAITKAKALFSRLPHKPFVSPVARESIQMEYDRNDGAYFELEVHRDHMNIFYSKGRYSQLVTRATDDQIFALADDFFNKKGSYQ